MIPSVGLERWLSSLVIFALLAGVTQAASDPKVDADLRAYDAHVASLNKQFKKNRGNPSDKAWVKAKLGHMVEVDQYMRKYANTPYEHGYTAAEQKRFQLEFLSRWRSLDATNTSELKALLKSYSWFRISEFGAQADKDAWLLVQHADQDREFQKAILAVLEKLYPKGETSPSNYAYLFDRVAYSPNDPTQRRPQRYGTQGWCTGPGTWAPWDVEDPEHLDERRKSVGLGSEAEYMTMFKEICKGA